MLSQRDVHSLDQTSKDAKIHVGRSLPCVKVRISSACSSVRTYLLNLRSLNRSATAAALSSHRATVFHESPLSRAMADLLTPSTDRCTTSSKVFRLVCSRWYGVPVFELKVLPQARQRYRRRRPCLVFMNPWRAILPWPGFPKSRHPARDSSVPGIPCASCGLFSNFHCLSWPHIIAYQQLSWRFVTADK